MAERVGAGRATGWTVVNILVILYALFPVLWILSPVAEADVKCQGRQAHSVEITFDNYKGIFSGDIVQLGADQLDRHRLDHHGDRGRDRRHGGLRGCATGVSR